MKYSALGNDYLIFLNEVSLFLYNEYFNIRDIEKALFKNTDLENKIILQIANLDLFSMDTNVKDISRVLVSLGKKNLRNVYLLFKTSSIIQKFKSEFDYSLVFKYSLSVAILSSMIAKRIFGKTSGDCFLFGFFHNLELYLSEISRIAKVDLESNDNPIFSNSKVLIELQKDTSKLNNFLNTINQIYDFQTEVSSKDTIGIVRIAIYLIYNLWNPNQKSNFEFILNSSITVDIFNNKDDYQIILMDFASEYNNFSFLTEKS